MGREIIIGIDNNSKNNIKAHQYATNRNNNNINFDKYNISQ